MAEAKRRYGCPRIYLWLRQEGVPVNHKKVERLHREDGLSLRHRARKKTTPSPSSSDRCLLSRDADMPWTLCMTSSTIVGASNA